MHNEYNTDVRIYTRIIEVDVKIYSKLLIGKLPKIST